MIILLIDRGYQYEERSSEAEEKTSLQERSGRSVETVERTRNFVE